MVGATSREGFLFSTSALHCSHQSLIQFSLCQVTDTVFQKKYFFICEKTQINSEPKAAEELERLFRMSLGTVSTYRQVGLAN